MENYGNDELVFTTSDYLQHYFKVSTVKISGILLILSSVLLIVWSISQAIDSENLNKTFLRRIIDNRIFAIVLSVFSVLFGYASIAAGFALLTTKIDIVY